MCAGVQVIVLEGSQLLQGLQRNMMRSTAMVAMLAVALW